MRAVTIGRLTDAAFADVSLTITRRWTTGAFSRTADLMVRSKHDYATVGSIEFVETEGVDDSVVVARVVVNSGHPYRLIQPLIDGLRAMGVEVEVRS